MHRTPPALKRPAAASPIAHSLRTLRDANQAGQGTRQLIEAAGIGQSQLELWTPLVIVTNERLESSAHFTHDVSSGAGAALGMSAPTS